MDIARSNEATSRSMAHVIKIYSNPVFDMEWIIQNFLIKTPSLKPTVVDQANQDPSWSSSHLTGLHLRDLIIDALNDNSLLWPMKLGYFTKSQWIKYMKQDSNFYTQQTNNATDFQAHDQLLLDLASKMLKRKICLI